MRNISLYLPVVIGSDFSFFDSARASEIIRRDWLLLHMSTQINNYRVSDFLINYFFFPINQLPYFDSKTQGGFMQANLRSPSIDGKFLGGSFSLSIALRI